MLLSGSGQSTLLGSLSKQKKPFVSVTGLDNAPRPSTPRKNIQDVSSPEPRQIFDRQNNNTDANDVKALSVYIPSGAATASPAPTSLAAVQAAIPHLLALDYEVSEVDGVIQIVNDPAMSSIYAIHHGEGPEPECVGCDSHAQS